MLKRLKKSSLFYSTSRLKATNSLVPQEFVIILKLSLSQMVAKKLVPPGFIGLGFWKTWPKKFTGVTSYDRQKEKVINYSQINNIYNNTHLCLITFQKKSTKASAEPKVLSKVPIRKVPPVKVKKKSK